MKIDFSRIMPEIDTATLQSAAAKENTPKHKHTYTFMRSHIHTEKAKASKSQYFDFFQCADASVVVVVSFFPCLFVYLFVW